MVRVSERTRDEPPTHRLSLSHWEVPVKLDEDVKCQVLRHTMT